MRADQAAGQLSFVQALHSSDVKLLAQRLDEGARAMDLPSEAAKAQDTPEVIRRKLAALGNPQGYGGDVGKVCRVAK